MCIYTYTIVCMINDRERENKAKDGQSCEAVVCWNTSVHGFAHHKSGKSQAAMVTLSEHFLNSFVCPSV